jgi:hypothetical protein
MIGGQRKLGGMVKQILPYLGGAVIGFLLSWILLPREEIDLQPYELQKEIQELEYQIKTDSIEKEWQGRYFEFEHGTTEDRDSILLSIYH